MRQIILCALTMFRVDLFAATEDACSISQMRSEQSGGHVVARGEVVINTHAVYLRSSREGKDCAVYLVLPGTPASQTPGLGDFENKQQDPKLARLMDSYSWHLRRHPGEYWLMKVSGVVGIKSDYNYKPGRKGNGFGGGSFRAAIVVDSIEWITKNAEGTQ